VLAGTFGALREPEFRLLWVGQLLSNAGNSLFPLALIFAVLEHGEASDVGIALAAMMIPNLLLTLVGGVWADRLPRQVVMFGSDVVRGTVQTLGAMLLVSGRAELQHLVILAIVYGSANAFFVPAASGLVPETVSRERLQQANALMSISRRATSVGGPLISGTLVAAIGPGWVYGIDGITFFASAVFLAAMTPTVKAVRRERFVTALVDGWREVRSRTWIWSSLAYFSAWNLVFAPFYVLGPVVAKRDLGGELIWGIEIGGELAWGIVLAMMGIGYLSGGAVSIHFRPVRPLFVGYLLIATYSVPLVLLAYSASVLMIGAAAAVGAATLEIANTLWYTTLQKRVPDKTLSRVMSYDTLGSLLFLPLGYLLVGPVADAVGERAALLGAAFVLWLGAVIVAAVPSVRNLRDEDVRAEPPPPARPEPAPDT
jgi:MFS family permease